MSITSERRARTIALKEATREFRLRHGLDDYEYGVPGGCQGEGATVDRAIAEEPCPNCATPRLYVPFYRRPVLRDRVRAGVRRVTVKAIWRFLIAGTHFRNGGDYRAFSVCPGCGEEMEF